MTTGVACQRLPNGYVMAADGIFSRLSLAKEHDLRHRQRLRVRDCHQRSRDFHHVGAPGRAAMQVQPRWSALPNHLDVFPDDALRLAGAEGFHRRFLHREPACEVRGRVSPLGTIGNLTRSEHALEKTIAVAIDEFGDTGNIGGVETNTENVHDRTTA